MLGRCCPHSVLVLKCAIGRPFVRICLKMTRLQLFCNGENIELLKNFGGGGGSRTRVRKCYWSRDYMLIRVHALGITQRRSRCPLRTDKKRTALACNLNLPAQT